MAYADYLHCETCDGKVIYVGTSEAPEDVVVFHGSCYRAAKAQEADGGDDAVAVYDASIPRLLLPPYEPFRDLIPRAGAGGPEHGITHVLLEGGQ